MAVIQGNIQYGKCKISLFSKYSRSFGHTTEMPSVQRATLQLCCVMNQTFIITASEDTVYKQACIAALLNWNSISENFISKHTPHPLLASHTEHHRAIKRTTQLRFLWREPLTSSQLDYNLWSATIYGHLKEFSLLWIWPFKNRASWD